MHSASKFGAPRSKKSRSGRGLWQTLRNTAIHGEMDGQGSSGQNGSNPAMAATAEHSGRNATPAETDQRASPSLINHNTDIPNIKFGEFGEGSGKLSSPKALAPDKCGNLYVLDDREIQKFTPDGEYVRNVISFKDLDYYSEDLVINAKKEEILCTKVSKQDGKANTIVAYKFNGQTKYEYKLDRLKRAWYLAVNSHGQIYVADVEANTIFIFDADGTFVKQFGGYFQGIGSIRCGANDDIIVSDPKRHRINLFDKQAYYIHAFGTEGDGDGQLNSPRGVTSDVMGNVLVCDSWNNRIQIFKHDGSFLGSIHSREDKLNSPWGLYATKDGNVLVCDRWNHCVKSYNYLNLDEDSDSS